MIELMRLFLVRHGQTAWNIAGRAQGHTDIPLDSTGLEQASSLGRSFRLTQIDRILSSDLTRSVQTARPVAEATGAEIELWENLRERGFGDWEGIGFESVAERIIEAALLDGISNQEVRPPGGESFRDVWNRLDRIVNEIHRFEGTLMVVTHGGAASLLLARLVQGTLDTSRSFRFANTGLCELQRRADGLYNLLRYNDTSHLATNALSGSLDGTGR